MQSCQSHLVIKMKCNWMIENLGFECRPVQAINHGTVLEVDTPFSFADGAPLAFYAQEHGKTIVLSDNGDTLAHLASRGLSVFEKRKWASIRSRIEQHEVTLGDDGEIKVIGSKDDVDIVFAKYMSAMLSVVQYERDSLSSSTDLNVLVEEVEMLFRRWRAGEQITLRPKVRGQSRREHSFDLQVGNTLVDAISPHANATGSVMRKAGDVMSSPFSGDRQIIVVIDDRVDQEAASVERDILSSLVKPILYSDLEGRANSTRH